MPCTTGRSYDQKVKAKNKREFGGIEKKPNENTELSEVSFGNQKEKQQKLGEGIL